MDFIMYYEARKKGVCIIAGKYVIELLSSFDTIQLFKKKQRED